MQSSKSHKSRKTAEDQASAGKPRHAPTPLDGNPPPVTALAPPIPSTKSQSDETIGPLTPLEAKKQWWVRSPDSKTRKIAEKIAVLDAAGAKDDYIAKKLKTTALTVRQTRYIARKNGWWDEDDQPIDLELDLAINIDRKIVRNIDASLDGQMTNWQTHEMTMAAAKGRGIFKNHESSKVESTEMRAVEIRVIMPALGVQDQSPEIPEDWSGGEPAFVDGELVGGLPTDTSDQSTFASPAALPAASDEMGIDAN